MNQKDTDVCSLGKDNVNSSNTIPASTTPKENEGNRQALREKRTSDVAIIGMSGRFAGSVNLEAFWSHLQAGESCIKKIQRKGWETRAHTADSDPERLHTTQIKWGGLLENIDQFDPLFFNISPLEAAKMDPQQRLFLEEAYKAFEDGGYSAEQLAEKKVGVFVGARSSDYKEQILRNRRDSALRLSAREDQVDAHLFLGNDMAILAARISYFLNLKGPSLTIDTASSSSLVAIHLACESIRTGESEMALAGGVFVMNSSEYYLMAAKTQMLSPDGKCKTFDKSANGIVLGEGVGAVVLKPLDTALADGDHIYGVIKGSALNQDGKTFGMTAPSLLSQKDLLCDLYKKADISPETVSYLEAHGTGSKLGDPIEVQALTEAFRLFTDKKQFCAIGSHKPNFGHTISSAGIAGVLKVLLAMKYQQIPPTINVEEANPEIDFQNSPFFLNTELLCEWKRPQSSPRRAGVSSFGLSGTNCHVILEESPLSSPTAREEVSSAFFFPFSAKTKAALARKVEDMLSWLEKEGEKYSAEDISYTLVQGRSHFSVRSAVVAKDTNELKQYLREIQRRGDWEQAETNGKRGHAWEQTELLFKEYGAWLFQELPKYAISDQNSYKEKMSSLAGIYVKGYNLDWGQIFQKERYIRVPLPTYPFTRESYWIETTPRDQNHHLTADPCDGQSRPESGLLPLQASTGRLREALSHIVSSLLKVRVEDIDVKTELSEYGFDSITFIELANRLNQTYQLDLTPAHFFEHSTIERLVWHLHNTSTHEGHEGTSPSSTQRSVDVGEGSKSRGIDDGDLDTSRPLRATVTTAIPIAIIGMSGCFPQAPDVQSLWGNLLAGRDCISEIPVSRWDWQTKFGDPVTSNPNQTNIKWAGIVEDVELFDPLFFGISRAEAEQMDPQQRLLMMYVWKAIEDAGYAASSLSGTNTALFIGTTSSGYSERLSRSGMTIEGYSSTGQTPSVGPGRISYFLNLHGPSEAIETACSSSLIAIHQGVKAIESGECSMAIVGGVNTLISPELHISYSRAGMLSPDGHCKTFSDQANGYVRGEGVGMLVLKKLSESERAGDHIYGVILGSAENHGGRASSLTAPNPRAQADLLIAAYRKAGIDPRTVSYIEAHGTGTALGDPIEINGLKTAFSELTQMKGVEPMHPESCGIGSVKSNIGHLEIAAGVTGVIKVLLQMQHKKLVKSLHCEQVNPYIQLEGSPFYIVRENREWDTQRDQAGNPWPRRAGVSSFGFGGANAHVVLEEYVPKERVGTGASSVPTRSFEGSPALIVLSAKNEARLHEQVRQLRAWVQTVGDAEKLLELAPDQALQALAYTLQVGRDAMEERLALQVSSLAELEEKLGRYLQESQEAGDWYRGQVKRHKDMGALLSADEELQEAMQEAVSKWLQRGKYERLLEWWVKGLRIDWRRLYGKYLPYRISLPTYPFARERYWVAIETSPIVTIASSPTALHPLVQQNVSDFFLQRFSSTFHGREFFLADHVISGQRTLPGAVYLEMARAAVSLAARSATLEEECDLSLRHIVWARPLVVGEYPITMHITLELQENGTISFFMSREVQEEENSELVYCQGTAVLQTQSASQSLDLSATQAHCLQQISAIECYQRYRSLGIDYGPAFQGIEQLSVGEGEALAKFRLPIVAEQTGTEEGKSLPYVLHPSVLDAALQVCVYLQIEYPQLREPHLPFALDELEIVGEVPAQGWIWVRRRADPAKGSMFDIEVCDDKGSLAVRLHGLSTRPLVAGKETQTGAQLLGRFEPLVGGVPIDIANDPDQERELECKDSASPLSEEKPQPLEVAPTDMLCEVLVDMASHMLKVRVEEIDAQTPLSEYGFDSITFTQFANRLNETYQLDLTPPLFFEYSTLERLAQYLRETYTAVLAPHFAAASPVVLGVSATTSEVTQQIPPASLTTEKNSFTGLVPRRRSRMARLLVHMSEQKELAGVEPIAIIGMSGAFPQAPDVQSLWNNLLAGRDCIGEIPASRWDWQTSFGNTATTQANKIDIKWAGIVEDVELFDPLFFGISGAEAEQMDPQQRLLMMHVWKAIEDAGYAASSLSGTNTALFVGMANSGYSERLSQAGVTIEGYSSTSQIASMGPNRISYFLNLHGPSEAIETACSSSLIAIHRGVNVIESGECNMAIVGGINALVSPERHISFSKAGMLSPDGRCKTFSDQANGYVRGEGVGILVLKKLSEAEQAGDHIYGVILGSAENHGGRASSLTAPNPRAQADVLIAAYRKAGIDPRMVGYIEAHGTGTALGDPIEINGLKTAFSELAEGSMHPELCGIGSVKSNIGHLEWAAGVTGVIKVLLQMQHKKLVKSLHCEQVNPYIQLEGSPFYIVQENREWEAPRDQAGNPWPRRAGVSSFGFGGANAHVVLEEYVPKEIQARRSSPLHFGGSSGMMPKCSGELASPTSSILPTPPVLIVLSAKDEERLHEQVRQLLAWVQLGRCTDEAQGLQDLAYTLQVGREAMEERLALQVTSLTELEERLGRYLQEPQAKGQWYRGQVRQHQETVGLLDADEEWPAAIRKWIQHGKYEKLLQWWVRGLKIEWRHLYGEHLPRRISLPTYPFARERYWIPIAGTESPTASSISAWGKPTGSTLLHPLVQHNTSTLWKQQFSSIFSGKEFFLADHVISGQRIMPGAAYLEMAYVAVREAIGASATSEPLYLRLSHVVWLRPLIVGEHPSAVRITLTPQESRALEFLISHASPGEEEGTLYCRGQAMLCAESVSQSLDLPAAQARCQHQVSATECYQRYRELSLNYGPAYQGIEQLSRGEGEALVRFRLPSVVAQTRTDFVLHPSVLDTALQACLVLLMESHKREVLHVPFALDELSIVGEVPTEGWAWVRQRAVGTGLVFDLDICDDEGRLAVSLRGLSIRALTTAEERQTVLLAPSWQEEAISEQEQAPAYSPPLLVLLCNLLNISASRIQAQLAQGERCISLHSPQPRREQRFQDAVVQLIQELQHLWGRRSDHKGSPTGYSRSTTPAATPSGPVLVQVVVAHREEPSLLEALAGVLKTAQQEYPQLQWQLIEIEGEPEEEELLGYLRENQIQTPHKPHIRYRDGKRWVRAWQECTRVSTSVKVPWKEGGCYLISGGAGGLARLFVQEIAWQVQQATVILIGRSAHSQELGTHLEQIANTGLSIDYQQVDVSDNSAVHALIQRVLRQHGHLDGIIHAAGVLRDRLLLNKTLEEVQAVLAPKVFGVEHLDEASREIPLDFFVLCSSLSAVIGNIGQADYAAANAYLDAFAHTRARQVLAGERQGITVSINWPLWEEGGMQVEAEVRQMMWGQLGIEAMGTEMGMKALYQALASGFAQVAVACGQIERIKQRLLSRFPESSTRGASEQERPFSGGNKEEQQRTTTRGEEAVREKASAYFKKQLADLIKLPMQRVEVSVPLSDYGFNSIMAIRFTDLLEESFGPLSKTLLFEHPTLDSVTAYFLLNYPEQLRSMLRIEGGEASHAPSHAITQVTGGSSNPNQSPSLLLGDRPHHRLALLQKGINSFPIDTSISDGSTRQGRETRGHDIAIIGLAGRYPGARDPQAFWTNLREGRDCISEIPPERWDYRLYFDTDKNKPGTTCSKWGGFLEGVDEFDPLFFNISPQEAERMDPQERLFLECVYAAIEDAGYTREALGMHQGHGLAGSVGVFVGVMYEEYQLLGVEAQKEGRPVALGGNASSIANRVSYYCNFHGPSLAVDSMCSSSLTAIHLACQSIECGDCKAAIAGGVNVSIHPNKYLLLGQSKFVSSQGQCQSFGVGADGYVPGEGVGAVLLKPLAQAEKDHDHIYGVIKATTINHGGKTNGYTVPNPHAQAEVIGRALKNAAIDPRTISYIEAHGTGTVLGDPIEIAGLTRAFEDYGAGREVQSSRPQVMDKQYCAIGSVKSNIGHAESAAGIAGLTKVLLQMRYGQLVPSLHSKTCNPHIDFSATPFMVQQELSAWKRPQIPGEGKEIPLRAGISSFGAGGSNAHVIVEEYVKRQQDNHQASSDGRTSPSHPWLIVFSARTEVQLHEQVEQLLAWIQEHSLWASPTGTEKAVEPADAQVGASLDYILDNLAYTLQVGREAMQERLALQVGSLQELKEKLQGYIEGGREDGDWYRGQVKRHDAISLFATDEDGQKAIVAWMSKGKYEKLLELWVKGATIDWRYLYGEHLPYRVSLPTYPFARERYWVHTSAGTGTTQGLLPLHGSHQPPTPTGAYALHLVDSSQEGKLLACAPLWDPIALQPVAVAPLATANQVVVIGGTAEEQKAILHFLPHAHLLEMPVGENIESQAERLAGIGSIEQVFWLAPRDCLDAVTEECLLSAQQLGVLACFRLIKAFLQLGYGSKSLGFTVITRQVCMLHTTETVYPAHAGLLGLFGALVKEYPRWHIQQVDLAADAPLPLADLGRLPDDPQGHGWLHRSGQWYRQILIPLNTSGIQRREVYRKGGVYVVIGGAGGISKVFSEYVIRHYQAQVIWLGRRKTNADIQAKQKQLAALGPEPLYLSADATNLSEMRQAYREIKRRFGTIHGVIHSALVLLDQGLAKMDEERFQASLAAKVEVSVRLAQVFSQESLDFVLFFSSLNAFARLAGQSNYAAGCTFEDAFAARLRQAWSCSIKVMNWGYWGSVGVVASPQHREHMAHNGIGSIEPAEAMQALEYLLTGPVDQMVLLKTTPTELPRFTLGGDLIQTQQRLTIYPEHLPSSLHNLNNYRSPSFVRTSVPLVSDPLTSEMEGLLYQFLWSYLQSLGLFREKQIVLMHLGEQVGISTSYDRWLEQSIALLERQHYLRCSGVPTPDGPVTCIVEDPTLVENVTLWQQWDQHKNRWMQNADLKAQVVLVETTLRALPVILTGKRPAVEILFPSGSMQLVEGIYQHNVIADSFNDVLSHLVVTYLQERLTHEEHARIRILEVGAGTGATTRWMLQSLQPYQASIAEYCYSDVSEVFLRYGQQMYAAEHPSMTYRLVNIEKPLAEQGIELGGYDLVIAANVLHATSNIRRTVRNMKAALKKHGWLLLNEITGTSIFSHLTFGLLPGWWAYEDPELRVPGGPALSTESWKVVLSSEGFKAISIPVLDVQKVSQQIIVAESDGISRQELTPQRVGAGLDAVRHTPQTPLSFGSTQTGTNPVPTDRMVFDHVQSIILESCAEVLKMREGEIEEDKSFAEYGVDSIVGINLINVINQKSYLSLPTTVLFDYNTVEHLCRYILREYSATLRAQLKEPAQSGEAREGAGDHKGREEASSSSTQRHEDVLESLPSRSVGDGFIPSRPLSAPVSLTIHVPSPPHVPQTTYQRVILEGPGGIDDLVIVETELPELKEREVRIAVHAFSLNFGDLLCVKGLYPTMPPYPFTPGFEASGGVLAVGRAVTAFRPGDPVMAVAGAALGGQASVMTCPEEHVFHKPDSLSFEEACALPVVAITMIAAFSKARLKPGEKILIQTATGGTGLIAIQLANYYKAEIYATAGSQPKLDYLKQLGVSYRINYQDTDFEQEIQRLTAGKGVDVVINTLSGDAIQKGMNCLAPGGRYIEIAMTALKSARTIDLSVLSRNQTFYSVDLRKLAIEDPATFKHYCDEMLRLVEEGIIAPTLSEMFDWENLKEAYRYLEKRQNIGKVVVRISQDHPARLSTISPFAPADVPSAASTHEPIAIIGMSGRFARCKNVSELWEHLAQGTDLVEEVPRWDVADLVPTSGEASEPYCKHGSFLEEIDLFDPLFFNISGLEARYMDPQQRLVLEESWKALEDAGYVGSSVEGRQCGVYIGCATGDYQDLFDEAVPAQAFWGNAGSVIPARIAYYLNLHGPAIAIDTACSSSLVAMHLACQGLWSGEIEMALAGGVFVECTPQFYRWANRAEMLSVTGRCSTFDNRADGFVPGEGVGVVVLKRLKDALASGDHIYGVLRGSGVNQDGATRGITAPSVNAQERLLRSVYETFQIEPSWIQMMEAHGTGTKLGDPIEFEALTRVFGKQRERGAYCALGSIKTNLGHTATAAGVAGVIKVLLSLQHKHIPPSLHFESGNEHIEWKGSPFYVNTQLQEWSATSDKTGGRYAAVSSFGFSGTNAHLVIEQAPEHGRRPAERPGYLIVLSARTSEQLRQQVEQLVTFCEQTAEIDCGNMSYTLLLGRRHLKHRLACVVGRSEELVALLRKWLEKGRIPQISVSDLSNREQRESPSLKSYGNQCIEECQRTTELKSYLEYLAAIADLYLQGYSLAYERLFTEGEYARISLPTYPFARESYWVPTSRETGSTQGPHPTHGSHQPPPPMGAYVIHPLMQYNTSTLREQRFSSTFRGDEFFLADHLIKGQRVLPGVAYLEMARAAIDQAMRGMVEQEEHILCLKNVVWAHPLVVDKHSITAHITLSPQEDETIAFRISREDTGTRRDSGLPLSVASPGFAIQEQEATGGKQVLSLLCQGRAVPYVPKPTLLNVDLSAVQSRCQHPLSAVECYQYYRELGISHGPAFQGIEHLSIGEGEALARLRLPVALGTSQGVAQIGTEGGQTLPYVLHPSVLDSALQACVGLLIESRVPQELRIPFALEELSIVEMPPAQGWAWVRRCESDVTSGSGVALSTQPSFLMDIDLCDDAGRLAVRLRGLRTRSVPGSFDQTQMRLLTPHLKEEESLLERTSSYIIEGQPQAIATMEEEASAYFKKQLADLIKVPVQQIDVAAPLSNYGFDSIIAVRFTNVLEGSFGPLSKTLLFEHPTLHSVTAYFLHNYPEQLRRVLGSEEAPIVIPQVTGEHPHDPSQTASFRQPARFLEKDVLKHNNHKDERYSVILAPNSSLLTGAGTNTIILGDQSTGAVIIDPATDDPEYLSVVIQEGQKYGGIRRILITHGHYDHIGGAEALRTQLGVPILAFSHKAVPFADEEVADNTLFPVGGDMLHAIHTPGHSPDHLCFWLEKQQVLFAGDLITNSGPSLIPPPPEGDLQDYIHSLERAQNLESVEIIPAHGETILGPQEMLAECLALCLQRKEQILAAVHDAPRGIDINTIVQALYKNVDPSLHDFMVVSVLSNLVMLEREGRVKHIENKQSEQKDYWILA